MAVDYLGEVSAHPSPRPSSGNYNIYALSTDNHVYFQSNTTEYNLTESTSHASNHTDGTDDIQDATASQKGLATAAQITKLDGIEANADVTDTTNVTAAGALMQSVVDAKGDLFVATADNTVSRLGIGTNGKVLVADSTETEGVKWQWSTPSATTADRTIYVDGTSGNDDTGTGAVGAPYQTWARVYEELRGRDIAHVIKLIPANVETYTSFPENWHLEKVDGGQVIFDASHLPWQTVAGPFTVTSATGVGPNEPTDLIPMATDYLVSGQSWTVDGFQGKFIRFITGAFAGYVQPIYRNTADTITSHANWYGVAAGDTFDIISAPVTIDVTHSISFTANQYRDTIATDDQFISFCGFEFKADASYIYPFVFRNIAVTFSFCNFVSDQLAGMYFNDCVVNQFNLASTTFSRSELADWYAFAWYIQLDDGDTIPDIGKSVTTINTNMTLLCCRGAYRSNYGSSTVAYTMARLFDTPDGGRHAVSFFFADTSTFAIDDFEADIICTSMYIHNCSAMINIRGKSHIRISWLRVRSGGISGAYAAIVARFSSVSLLSGSSVESTALGSSGAINFASRGVTQATWPASANAYFTDGAQSTVLRES